MILDLYRLMYIVNRTTAYGSARNLFSLKVQSEDAIFHPNYHTNDNVLCNLSECLGAQHPASIQFIAAATYFYFV